MKQFFITSNFEFSRQFLRITDLINKVFFLQDTKCFARSFQAETPIKKGQVNHQDRDLLDRIIAQV